MEFEIGKKRIKHLIIAIKFSSGGYIRLISCDPHANNNIKILILCFSGLKAGHCHNSRERL